MRSGISAMENYAKIVRRYDISGTASSIVRTESSELLAALFKEIAFQNSPDLRPRKNASEQAALPNEYAGAPNFSQSGPLSR
jgi:hypothetical protein